MKKRMKQNKQDTEKTEADVLAVFTQYLDALKWKYRPSADRPTIYCGFNGDDAHWDFNVTIRLHSPGVFFAGVNSSIPIKARPDRRAAMAELLTRLNYSLNHGCWEMDYQEGDIPLDTKAADSAIGRRAQRQASQEELRLLYVGLTRARDRLVLAWDAAQPQAWLEGLKAPWLPGTLRAGGFGPQQQRRASGLRETGADENPLVAGIRRTCRYEVRTDSLNASTT